MPAKTPRIAHAALADLEEIWLYIASDNPTAASKMIDELYRHIYRLAAMPGMGTCEKTSPQSRCDSGRSAIT